jgi:hypothetical protein
MYTQSENQARPAFRSLMDRLGILSTPVAITARRLSAHRNRLVAPPVYPGEVQHPSREDGAFAVTAIPAEPKAMRSEIGCSTLQP